MMHELAHNKQMNHSKAFWGVRNEFSTEMKVLWDKGYTGDGLWGRGVLLENGIFAQEQLEEGEILPDHMCGGTFKSRGGKKRKAKPKITYKERQEKRIRKKFGVNGMTLGADEEVKFKLEKGKKPAGKPRVAGSARGRELRAAAALARFDVKKEEPQIKDEELVTDSDSESATEGKLVIKAEPDDAVDINGIRLVDKNGRGMVRICEDEDKNDEDAKNELLELQNIPGQSQRRLAVSKAAKPTASLEDAPLRSQSSSQGKSIKTEPKPITVLKSEPLRDPAPKSQSSPILERGRQSVTPTQTSTNKKENASLVVEGSSVIAGNCPICSVINEPTALTCMVCGNVLKPEFVTNSWSCKSSTCMENMYINAGDVGICGVCGARKCS